MRAAWEQVLVRHGKAPAAAHRAVAKVPVGHHLVASRSSVQLSVDRHAPPSDAFLLCVPSPTIPPRSFAASGRARYWDLEQIGRGGFGEVFKGQAETETRKIPFALKRALPSAKPGTDIEQYLDQQIRRLDALKREGQVYFSRTLNSGECLHLTLLYDVAQARNTDGYDEPLLVLPWADGPGNTLRGWMKKNTDIAATIEARLGLAVQMVAGLRELHYGNSNTPTAAVAAAAEEGHHTTLPSQPPATTPLFVHQDLKPANILLFGGGEGDDGPVRLALTDFGMTLQYNVSVDQRNACVGGSPCYMAPEQWHRVPALSPGRDMWAAGMVLAQLFAGACTARALEKYRSYVKNGELFHLAALLFVRLTDSFIARPFSVTPRPQKSFACGTAKSCWRLEQNR